MAILERQRPRNYEIRSLEDKAEPRTDDDARSRLPSHLKSDCQVATASLPYDDDDDDSGQY